MQAGTDGDVVLGASNTASANTRILNYTTSETVLTAQSTGDGIALHGSSGSGYGVYGYSYGSGLGVYGTSGLNVGVHGISSATDQPGVLAQNYGGSTGLLGASDAAPPAKPKTGVYGYANQDQNSKGVWGFSGKGVGVYAQANKAGYALRTSGRIKADKVSGVATIAAGSTSVTINPNHVKISSSSFVLLTPKANLGSRGLWFTTNPSADTITIHISSSRPSATKVAWLMLG